jgi:hypothetical protein
MTVNAVCAVRTEQRVQRRAEGIDINRACTSRKRRMTSTHSLISSALILERPPRRELLG